MMLSGSGGPGVSTSALRLLRAEGYDTSGFRSKSWDEFGRDGAPEMDAVITVCGSARDEECPYWPGAPLRAHWGIEDPAAAPQKDQPAAFAHAFDLLSAKAESLLALPFEDMTADDVQAILNRIGG